MLIHGGVSHIPVLVHLDLGDHHVRGVHRHRHGLAVHLLPLQALHVDDPLLAVHLDNLALRALRGAPNNEHLVVLPDGEGADLRGSASAGKERCGEQRVAGKSAVKSECQEELASPEEVDQ